MRTLLTVLSVAIILVAGAASADDARLLNVDQPDRIPSFLGYAQDKFIVVMNPAVSKLQTQKASSGVIHIGNADFDAISDRFAVSNLRQQFQGSETRAPELARYYKIHFENGSLEDAMAAYAGNPLVDHVEPIGIHTMYATPNDNYFSPYQWYHNATGDHDIDSPEAWDIQTGSTSIILAILDSGTRYYHPDLGGANASPTNPGAARGNMWINTAELNGSSGVDDDGNGYVDDWIGYDFIDGVSNCWPGEDCNTKDNDPRDFNGHGTHTAGIMGMLTNDGYGMAGVAGGWGNGSQAVTGNGCKIMALRMGYSYNYLGQEYGVVMMDAAAEAFYYAANNGARIASCSWGSSNSGGIGTAATYFINNGGIIFVAAGNDGSQTADYLNGRGDCVSVAATNESDNAASFTTYGTWVDISAPGNNIYATYHDHTDPNTNYWAALSGTSMATPMAAAVGGLIWSQNPAWTAAQVKTQLFSSADNIDAYLSAQYIGKMGAGRINAYNAVNTGPPPAPVADFSGSPTTGTEPLTVNFTDLSTGSISTWAWTFGDGGTSSAQNPSYTYTAAGTYSVTLTVTGPGGSDALTRTNYITVDPCTNPTANFVGSPTLGDYPLTVNFTNQSSGATSYNWAFGDGGTSTATNPSYTYTAAGTYTVTLTATNSCGSDQLVRTDYITVTTPPCNAPVADFSGAPTSGTYPLTVNFTDLSTNSPTSWSWAFGDGGTSTAQNPSYTYTAAGTYTVEMTATNACGFDNVVKTGYITVTAPTVETAFANADISVLGTYANSFAETQASDNVYETITEALSTGHPVKTTSQAEHKWTFAVNATGAATFYLEAYRSNNADGDNFTFAYSTDDVTYVNLVTVASATEQVYTAGMPSGLTGTVYIRVVDSDRSWGNTSLDNCYVDNMYIEYSSTPGPPVANFAGDPTAGVVPLTVAFTDLSTGSPTSWNWDFGDGGTSTAQNPSYTYNSAGSYTVSLTATNAYGSGTETKVNYINVTPAGQTARVSSISVVNQAAGGPNRQAVATVTVVDGNGNPLSGAVVSGYFNAPNGNIKTGTTDASGVATISSDKTKTPPVDWCFTVTDVALAGYAWNQGDTTGCESTTTAGAGGPGAAKLLPSDYVLSQNYPNPFNPTTEIEFSLPQAGHVNLTIYNVVGQQVAVMADGYMDAGVHHVTWEASGFATGIYFYRLTTNSFTQTKKMLLVK